MNKLMNEYVVSFPKDIRQYVIRIKAYTKKQALSKAIHSKQLPFCINYLGKYYERGNHLLIDMLLFTGDYIVEEFYSKENTIPSRKDKIVIVQKEQWLSLL